MKKNIILLTTLVILLFLIAGCSNAGSTNTKVASQPNKISLQNELQNYFSGESMSQLVDKYEFQQDGSDPRGTVKIWVKTEIFYMFNSQQQKDLVSSIGNAINVACARNDFSNGCGTEFYSEANRLIAEHTIWGNIKIY